MPVPITCTSCGANGTAPEAAQGKTVRCPKCRSVIQVPSFTAFAAEDWPVEATPSTWKPPVPKARLPVYEGPPVHDPALEPLMLKACPFCAEDILLDAIKCRFCGSMLVGNGTAKKKEERAESVFGCSGTGCLIIGALVVGLAVFIMAMPEPAADPNPRTRVIHAARHVVRQGLGPKPAKFPLPEDGDYQVTDLGGGRYRVSGYVDTVNAFNAPSRVRWTVTLRYVDATKYVVESID